MSEQNTAKSPFTQGNAQKSNTTGRAPLFMPDRIAKKQIYDWICTDPYLDFLNYMHTRVIGQEEVTTIVTNVYSYLRRLVMPSMGIPSAPDALVTTKSNANNMLLCAPSGCGKTETYRALKDYFMERIPALQIIITDVSNITSTGFRGPDPASIVEPLLAGGTHPVGIVFMDEFDKICIPSFTADHSNIHLEVQHNLLTMIEGAKVELRRGTIDTSNLLFIGTGSFDDFRKTRQEEKAKGIGFSMNGYEQKETHDLPIRREDMIQAGGCYELIGRFSYIVNYHHLDRETLLAIIQKVKSGIERDFGCEIVLEPKMMDYLYENSNSKFGCRLLDSVMRDPVLRAYGDSLASQKTGDVLVVTLQDSDMYSFGYREFTESERMLQKIEENDLNEFQSDGTDYISGDARRTFEEALAALFMSQ